MKFDDSAHSICIELIEWVTIDDYRYWRYVIYWYMQSWRIRLLQLSIMTICDMFIIAIDDLLDMTKNEKLTIAFIEIIEYEEKWKVDIIEYCNNWKVDIWRIDELWDIAIIEIIDYDDLLNIGKNEKLTISIIAKSEKLTYSNWTELHWINWIGTSELTNYW